MAKTIHTASGRTRDVPEKLDPARIVGLDEDGRIVVDDFGAMKRPPHGPDDQLSRRADQRPYIFGLTLCCDASDKGTEDGVVCRACYGDEDTGHYIFQADDGSFPGLDPVARIE